MSASRTRGPQDRDAETPRYSFSDAKLRRLGPSATTPPERRAVGLRVLQVRACVFGLDEEVACRVALHAAIDARKSTDQTSVADEARTVTRHSEGVESVPGTAGARADLALFDFDGTITTKGTYPSFVRFAVRPRRKRVGGPLLAPFVIAYRCRLLSDRAIRLAISRVAFWGEQPDRLKTHGQRFADEVLPDLIRPVALERIAWHKARGDRVVVVSAALDVYLEPWCRKLGVDVICTELEVRDGRLTGRYLPGDCSGKEKARRVREHLVLRDYTTVYAYGDTEEDRQMLEMADRKWFRWQEVSEVPAVSRATRRGDGGT